MSGWSDNRVRALVMEPRSTSRLRYLITSFYFRQRVAFGFVEINSKDTKYIQDRYKIHPSLDTLLVFNEDSSRPVASVSMADIPSQTLHNVISANQYLALPRLSSQQILEGVCPAEWNRPTKKLCVILITQNTNSHDNARHALRKIALEAGYSPDRVRFAYIYKEKQIDFIKSLTHEHAIKPEDTILRVVIIWRRDTNHVKYEWVHGATLHQEENQKENETTETTYNSTKQKLDHIIQKLLKTSEALSYEAEVKVRIYLLLNLFRF